MGSDGGCDDDVLGPEARRVTEHWWTVHRGQWHIGWWRVGGDVKGLVNAKQYKRAWLVLKMKRMQV